jgi:hypothetical protein
MIYPWYDEDRWLRERFTGPRPEGELILREYGPKQAVIYFRRSYASFRVNGLQYARLPSKMRKVQYGIEKAPLRESETGPQQLVEALVKMFDLLIESDGATSNVGKWASGNYPPNTARFLEHVAHHHQAEHWLESKLLQSPSALSDSFQQVRSQVVVAQVGEKARGFIDILALDTRNRLLWVVELKVPKAELEAIGQAKEYVRWVEDNMLELLDESFGYFDGIAEPNKYRPAIMFAAPDFSSDFHGCVENQLPCFRVMMVRINDDWRKNVKVVSRRQFKCDCNNEKQEGLT